MAIANRWVANSYHDDYGTATYYHKVTNVEADGSFDIKITSDKDANGRFVHYRKNDEQIDGIVARSSKVLSFPLFLGKKWKVETSGRKIRTKKIYRYSFSHTVDKIEKIKTSAGMFTAFKIKRYQHNLGNDFRYTDYFWYASEAKCIVKSEFSYKKGTDLLSYRIK
ncbi:MAG: hypothetical protein GY749_07670 [Desulfobacteraceae bacterium]|nr:hypothetical protein [Desulfobacteraceae bacterium]